MRGSVAKEIWSACAYSNGRAKGERGAIQADVPAVSQAARMAPNAHKRLRQCIRLDQKVKAIRRAGSSVRKCSETAISYDHGMSFPSSTYNAAKLLFIACLQDCLVRLTNEAVKRTDLAHHDAQPNLRPSLVAGEGREDGGSFRMWR